MDLTLSSPTSTITRLSVTVAAKQKHDRLVEVMELLADKVLSHRANNTKNDVI